MKNLRFLAYPLSAIIFINIFGNYIDKIDLLSLELLVVGIFECIIKKKTEKHKEKHKEEHPKVLL